MMFEYYCALGLLLLNYCALGLSLEDLSMMYSSFMHQGKSLFLEARLGGRVLGKLEMVDILGDGSEFFDKP